MRAKRVAPSAERPHGIQYALTFHAPDGARLLGYDNAHRAPVRSNPSRKSGRPIVFDHLHRRDRTRQYIFKTPADLLVDFWADVEAILAEEGQP